MVLATITTVDKSKEQRLQELEMELAQAIDPKVENYERAAQIRDEIKKLNWEVPEKIQENTEEAVQAITAKTEEHQAEMAEVSQKAEKEKTEQLSTLTNQLQDSPEEKKEDESEVKLEEAKGNVNQIVDDYQKKLVEMKNTSKEDKEKIDQLNKDIEALKAEHKKRKATYEQIKKDFFQKIDYQVKSFTKEDLGKVSTRRVRYEIREGKLFNTPKLTKMKTLRRNMTMRKLIKKFNKIGSDHKKGIRFIMGFSKQRFLRYTGISMTSLWDRAASSMGMRMPANEFHAFFNAGRNNIFALLDADTGNKIEKGEEEIIKALKKRIDYYGFAYAQERATERTKWFVDSELNTKEGENIIKPTEKTKPTETTTKTPEPAMA